MNESLKVFLASLIIYPMLLFGIFLAFIAAAAFVSWEWHYLFHNVDFLLAVRVSCVIGWAVSLSFAVNCIKEFYK